MAWPYGYMGDTYVGTCHGMSLQCHGGKYRTCHGRTCRGMSTTSWDGGEYRSCHGVALQSIMFYKNYLVPVGFGDRINEIPEFVVIIICNLRFVKFKKSFKE